MTEAELIALFYPTDGVRRLDDCAFAPPANIITTDGMAEGVHFRRDWSTPEDLAIKLAHSNLSDIAADGGQARWALLNLGLPSDLAADFAPRFARTLRAELAAAGAELIGGDCFRAPALFFSLTLAGEAERRLERSGGRAGDLVCVTGELGLALLGYQILSGKTKSVSAELRERALAKHLRPRARLAEGRELARNPAVHAMMDVSDGLAADLPRLAAASELSLEIHLESIPCAAPEIAPRLAAESGEEFELVFLAAEPPALRGAPVHVIGRARPAGPESVVWRDHGQIVATPTGFAHFA